MLIYSQQYNNNNNLPRNRYRVKTSTMLCKGALVEGMMCMLRWTLDISLENMDSLVFFYYVALCCF